MKKTILFFLLTFAAVNLMAQTGQQQQSTDSICKLVVKYINEKSAEKLYQLTSQQVKQKMSLDNWKNIFQSEFFPYTPIKQTLFQKFENNTAYYKVFFSHPSKTFNMSLQINRLKKIEELNFN